jgi:hypothetical protein
VRGHAYTFAYVDMQEHRAAAQSQAQAAAFVQAQAHALAQAQVLAQMQAFAQQASASGGVQQQQHAGTSWERANHASSSSSSNNRGMLQNPPSEGVNSAAFAPAAFAPAAFAEPQAGPDDAEENVDAHATTGQQQQQQQQQAPAQASQMDVASLASTPVDVGNSVPATPGDREVATPGEQQQQQAPVNTSGTPLAGNVAAPNTTLARALQDSLHAAYGAGSVSADNSSISSDVFNTPSDASSRVSAFTPFQMPASPIGELKVPQASSRKVPQAVGRFSPSSYAPPPSMGTFSSTISSAAPLSSTSLPSSDTLQGASTSAPSAKNVLLTPPQSMQQRPGFQTQTQTDAAQNFGAKTPVTSRAAGSPGGAANDSSRDSHRPPQHGSMMHTATASATARQRDDQGRNREGGDMRRKSQEG